MTPFHLLVRAELLRMRSTRSAAILLSVGVGLLLLSNVGLAQQAATDGQTSNEATLTLVRNGFSLSLFSALAAALGVGGQLTSGEGARAWLAARSWSRLLGAQAVAAAATGLLFGLLGAAVATASAAVILPAQDLAFTLGPGSTQAIVGVIGVVVAAALWGAAIGALVVRPVAAAGVIVVEFLVLEPILIRVWDLPSKFLFGNAMSAVYGDQQSYALLSPVVGTVVLIAWCAAGIAGAVWLRARRDVPMHQAS